MNAAPISVMFNISEGFLRRRDREMAQFLRYSFASNGELKAGYYASEGLDVGTRRGPRTRDQGRTKGHGRTKHREPRTKD